MFPQCSLNVPWMNVPWMFLDVPPLCRFLAHLQLIITMEALCDWTRSSTPVIRRLVLLTLVLGTHVCTFVLFLSASCSWDGGSRASAQLSLNIPWMFPECSLNVPWRLSETLPECSLKAR
jgi:hypothetical protein